MKFKPLAFAFCLLLALSAAAADKLAIAEPVVKGNVLSKEEADLLWSMLESSVDGGYELISRSALKQLLTEINLTESSGLTELNSEQRAKLGELKTVRYLLISNIGKFGSRRNISLMVLDASTGQILPDRKIAETFTDMDELADTAGGANIEFERSLAGKIIRRESPCTNPGGHQWVYTHHDEERNTLFIFPFFGTKGYNYFKCEYCNRTKRERV